MEIEKTGLAQLFVEYYIFVQKKKNIQFTKSFSNEELHDLQYTLLLLLNHLGTDENNTIIEDPAIVEEALIKANEGKDVKFDEEYCKTTELVSEVVISPSTENKDSEKESILDTLNTITIN